MSRAHEKDEERTQEIYRDQEEESEWQKGERRESEKENMILHSVSIFDSRFSLSIHKCSNAYLRKRERE